MFLPDHVSKRIIATPLISSVYEDKMVWEGERNGCYSVKFGYQIAIQFIIRSDKYNVIWKAYASYKACHLLWRLCKG
jgi:hypothetical protein